MCESRADHYSEPMTTNQQELLKKIRELQRQYDEIAAASTVPESDANVPAERYTNPQALETPGDNYASLDLPPSATSNSLTVGEGNAEPWTQVAFGPAVNLESQLERLAIDVTNFAQPSGDNWLSESDVDKEVTIQGILYNYKIELGKGQKKGKGKARAESKQENTIHIELTPESESEAKAFAIVMECGVGSDTFQTIADTLKECGNDEEHLLVVRGCVQQEGSTGRLFLCVNDANRHVTQINICPKPAEYPEVYSVQGLPINFPTSLKATGNEDSIHLLIGSFSDAWFYQGVSHFEEFSKSVVKKLRQHIAAYRTSGCGGIIYIGLKLTKRDDGGYDVKNDPHELSVEQLAKFIMQIQEFCSSQCPPCTAVEWTQRALPTDVNKRRDQCLYSVFSTKVKPPKPNRFVFRLAIFPSHEKLHLCKESHIGLRKKNGSNSSCYSLDEFVSMMNENVTSSYYELSRLTASGSHKELSFLPGDAVPLWKPLLEEVDTLEYKECGTGDPVKIVVEELRDYAVSWLNSEKRGTLRIGVSDKPPLATGVWLNDQTASRLQDALTARFGGSLDRKNFCFPSMLQYFSIIKCPIIAHSSVLLSKSSKVLILWLKCEKHDEGFDYIRRQLYKLWAEKKHGALSSLFEKMAGRRSIVLPINVTLLKDRCKTTEHITLFPVTICHGFQNTLSKQNIKKMTELINGLTALIDKRDGDMIKYVNSYQFVDLPISINVAHQDYCIIDIVVEPPPNKGIYLCKVPKFYKVIPHVDNEHIGRMPAKMEFEDIVLHCSDYADHHRKSCFNDWLQPCDRPILITDCLNHEDCVKGFVHIPWSLIISFDFEGSPCTNSFKALDKPYCNDLTYLSLNKDDPVDFESMSDASPVYCVHALGTSSEYAYEKDAEMWLKDIVPPLTRYIERACAIVKDKVKILVVWSSFENRKDFVKYIASHVCLDILRVREHSMEIRVVSPSVGILTTFAENEHSKCSKAFHLKLDQVSTILLNVPLQESVTKEQYLRVVPGGSSLLPLETWNSMKVNELHYLYPSITNDLKLTDYDCGLAFFEGREKFVKWEHLHAGVVVERDVTKKLMENIEKLLNNKYRKKREIQLVHYPGTGGSTVARHALWKLKDRYCCVIPFQIYKNLKKDIEQLSETSKNSVVVLWDTNLGIDFDTLKFMLGDSDVVFLCVKRAFNPSDHDANVRIPENLTIQQLKEFCYQLSSNRNFKKKALDAIMIREERDKKGVPVFLVMITGLETREFIQLPDYVNDRLAGLTAEQKEIMLQVAFAQLYTGKPLELRVIVAKDKEWQRSLPSSVHDLIRFGDHNGAYGYVHMRHHLIDELVISKIKTIMKDSEDWGEWMASFVVPFIDHLRREYPIACYTEGLINEFERILRILFHDKSDTMSLPYFITQIKNKSSAIACMRKVQHKLPHNIKRIRAHFLGDLARVHLIMDKENDLTTAIKVMNEAHKLLPKESTLHHQMGQLYYNSMKLTNERWLGEKHICADELIKLAQNASGSFGASRDCELINRLDTWVPWKSDVQCRVECLSYICKLMDCNYLCQLPESLCETDYIKKIEEETFILLDTLHEYDPPFYNIWSSNLSKLLRTKPDCSQLVKDLLEEIHSDMKSDKIHSAQHRAKLTKCLQRIHYIYRVQMYDSGRRVHIDDATLFTKTLYQLIVLRTEGFEENFFELELLWDWSRFSKEPIGRTIMLGIIDRYLQNVTDPELKARCWLFQGVICLLRRLSGEDLSVQPEDIVKRISCCCDFFKHQKSSWKRTEFIISDIMSEDNYNLLSFKDWNPHYRHVHLLINNNKALNLEYEKRKHIRFIQFSGKILPGDDEVQHKGLRFAFKKKKVPGEWRMSQSEVEFYIAVSSRDGLQAYASYKVDDEKIPITDHTWPLGERTKGLIIEIKGNSIHFGPPNKDRPYKRSAICSVRDVDWKPKLGDLCEFQVRKEKIDKNVCFEALEVSLLQELQT